MQRRRGLLLAGATLALPLPAAASDAAAQALRSGQAVGGVLMFRHALAPGTFDPPGFQLGDCSTQRNLSDEGRRQARQIGAWFTTRQLRPVRVRSSPWCRCMETARLAFGDPADAWPALGSPRAGDDAANAQALTQLRAGLAAAVKRQAGFEVWVTHMFIFSALLGEGAGSGDAVLLGLGPDGAPSVKHRLTGLTA
ncbi:MAG: histidine phosphatase family protein [Burkholderiales bacterium PBB5]|nr:MAG: histidine phosphatase family protein [Burkholderiales bacterium PBB5]